MVDETSATDGRDIDRRTILRGAGAAGVVGAVGTGLALGQLSGGGGDTEQGNQPDGPPWDYCDCPDSNASKYEFVQDSDEDCQFELEEGDHDPIEIHYDPTDPDQNKNDDDLEPCEPITIDFTVRDGYRVTRLCAQGGNDDESETYDLGPGERGTYVSDLETGGEQQAAISNFIVCFEELEEEFVGYQVDLIHGDVLETLDPDTDTLYNRQNRLLQAYWSGTGMDDGIDLETNTDEYQHCLDQGLDIHQDITPENDTATACLSLPSDHVECDLSEFKLVVYSAPVDTWTPDRATEQAVYDYDDDPETGFDNGRDTVCFEVDLPPLMDE